MRTALAERLAAKKPAPEFKAEIGGLEVALDIVRTVANTENTHCRASDLSELERHVVLPSRERLFLDVIRMLACRAKTRMTLPIIHAQGRKPNPSKLLQTMMTADADNRLLEVWLPGPGADAWDRHIAPLLDEFSATESNYPDTRLRIVCTCSSTDSSPKPVASQVRRGQDICIHALERRTSGFVPVPPIARQRLRRAVLPDRCPIRSARPEPAFGPWPRSRC